MTAALALLSERTRAASVDMATPAAAAPAPSRAAPAAAPADAWMYSTDGRPKGPLPGFSLLRLLERGVVPPEATVWAPHLREWAPITEASGLAVCAKLCRARFYVAGEDRSLPAARDAVRAQLSFYGRILAKTPFFTGAFK